MHDPKQKSWAAVLVCLAAVGALRCNAVLGIESAELDPTFGASGTGGSGTGGSATTGGSAPTGGTSGTGAPTSRNTNNVPYPACDNATQECAACIATCPGFDLNACVANKVCREALEAYRGCLGSTCMGEEGLDCVEETLFGTNEPLLVALVECLKSTGPCREDCAGSPLARMCELYCGCMKDNCSSKPIATDPNCVAACEAGPTMDATIAHCRKFHCEFIDTDPLPAHCDHAIGVEQCLAPVAPEDCANDGILPSFPCQPGVSLCCSGICQASHTCL